MLSLRERISRGSKYLTFKDSGPVWFEGWDQEPQMLVTWTILGIGTAGSSGRATPWKGREHSVKLLRSCKFS